MAAPTKQDIEAATQKINELLSTNPKGIGTPLDDGRLQLIVPPLAVAYKVSDDDGTVTVVNVWLAKDDLAP